MKPAYIDTSLLIGLKFQKPALSAARTVSRYELFSSELLIAELFAFGKRESVAEDLLWKACRGLCWIVPASSIASEIDRVSHAGYARGPTCGIWLAPAI